MWACAMTSERIAISPRVRISASCAASCESVHEVLEPPGEVKFDPNLLERGIERVAVTVVELAEG